MPNGASRHLTSAEIATLTAEVDARLLELASRSTELALDV